MESEQEDSPEDIGHGEATVASQLVYEPETPMTDGEDGVSFNEVKDKKTTLILESVYALLIPMLITSTNSKKIITLHNSPISAFLAS